MTEKPAWLFRQSGVVPYRVGNDGVEVLLITSHRRRRWVIPKGVIEPNLTARESAAKEAVEEAGVRGELSTDPIGAFEYDKWGGTCHVQVFSMRVDELLTDWPERELRQRSWCTGSEAQERVDEPELRHIIDAVIEKARG